MTVILLIMLVTLSFAEAPADLSVPSGPMRISVADKDGLKKALRQVLPGTTVAIAPGLYSGGISLKNIHGTAKAPITITGADPNNPPVFEGNGEGAKLSNCSYVKLGSMVFQGFSGNGINIDDGGDVQTPSHHIVIENLVIQRIGPKGNLDALKMSGVNHFVIRNCRFEAWGGSGIDLVGCHHGLIEGCRFLGREGYRTANGIQIKGGSRFILVQTSLFRNAGERAINLGGSTGLAYFRPAAMGYEARDIGIAGNIFIGGEAQIAWVTSQYTHVHHNLFYYPGKWVGRILQETKDRQFDPCRKGLFENNLVVTDDRVRTFFNAGRGTEPETFAFRGNAWFRPNGGGKPRLPTKEIGGSYDLDPAISESRDGGLTANSRDPRLKQLGPWSYVPVSAPVEFSDVILPLAIEIPVVQSAKNRKTALFLAGGGVVLVGYLGFRALGFLFGRGSSG
jgi:hypothetical protein